MVPLNQIPGLANASPAFRSELPQVCERLGIPDPNWLAAVISFESARTFAPDVVLGGGRYRGPVDDRKAVGLIQFTDPAIRAMKLRGWSTTKAQLAAMSDVEQLTWVERYFVACNAKGRMSRLADVYAAVFAPAGVGRPLDTPLYSAPSRAYTANRGLDRDSSGAIELRDLEVALKPLLAAGERKGPFIEPPPTTPPDAPKGVGLANAAPFRSGDPRDLGDVVTNVRRLEASVCSRLDRTNSLLVQLLDRIPA